MKLGDIDSSYRYFRVALEYFKTKYKEQGIAPGVFLSLELGVEERTISKYLSRRRLLPIPFNQQMNIANAFGFDYLSFLQIGKKLDTGEFGENGYDFGPKLPDIDGLIDPPEGEPSSFKDRLHEKHTLRIKGFVDHKIPLEINEDLIQIQKIDNDELEEIRDIVKAKLRKLEKRHGDPTQGKPQPKPDQDQEAG